MKTRKEIIERALKTFVEAFIPTFIAALAAADYTNVEILPRILVSILISAAATGISAVWNALVDPWLKGETGEKIEEIIDEEE